jgi:amidase
VTLAPDAVDRARALKPAAICTACRYYKDTIETAGLRTTSGSRVRADYVPERDATAVARLKAAGAIVLGKTNAAEMAMDYTADNPVFGRTVHPLNATLTPGGSSGGEAVAIATGMSQVGSGSDLAGRFACRRTSVGLRV